MVVQFALVEPSAIAAFLLVGSAAFAFLEVVITLRSALTWRSRLYGVADCSHPRKRHSSRREMWTVASSSGRGDWRRVWGSTLDDPLPDASVGHAHVGTNVRHVYESISVSLGCSRGGLAHSSLRGPRQSGPFGNDVSEPRAVNLRRDSCGFSPLRRALVGVEDL
jgi:hypothetical protein